MEILVLSLSVRLLVPDHHLSELTEEDLIL